MISKIDSGHYCDIAVAIWNFFVLRLAICVWVGRGIGIGNTNIDGSYLTHS